MQGFSKKHSVVIGGSFLCRVPEGGVRNRYLCFSNGRLIGKHDKDIPTMWESSFYESADKNDLGIIGDVGGVRIGSAVCWEFMRTNTSRRMKNQVDIVMGGSHWWSMQGFSKKHSVVIGGSFLCRVPEGGVRNRYLCF
ncbi:hypothetical protein D9B85_13445, partial [Corynebacterium diphtheriae]